MKMKEFGPRGGARVPGAPPWSRQCLPGCLKPSILFLLALSLERELWSKIWTASELFRIQSNELDEIPVGFLYL